MINIRPLLYFLLYCTNFIHTHIYQIHIARKRNSQSQCDYYVIGFSDMHSKNHAQNATDKEHIIQFLSSCSPRETATIVEDLSSCNQRGVLGCHPFFFDSRGGVLGGITKDIQAKNIETHNIEYRYCRAAGFGPVYKTLISQNHNSGNIDHPNVPLWMINQEVSKTIDIINHQLKENKLPQTIYPYAKKTLGTITQKVETLQKLSTSKKTVKDIAHTMTKQSLDELLTFDSSLIDLLILQNITKLHHKKHIVVLAGGTHIQKSFALLTSLGYETIFFEKIDSLNKQTITRLRNIISGR